MQFLCILEYHCNYYLKKRGESMIQGMSTAVNNTLHDIAEDSTLMVDKIIDVDGEKYVIFKLNRIVFAKTRIIRRIARFIRLIRLTMFLRKNLAGRVNYCIRVTKKDYYPSRY